MMYYLPNLIVCLVGLGFGFDLGATERWLNDFAIETNLDLAEADLAVGIYGFRIVRKLEFLPNVYHIRHQTPCKVTCDSQAADLVDLLKNSPFITAVEQQHVLHVDKRNHRRKPDVLSQENRKRMQMLSEKYAQEDEEYHNLLQTRSIETNDIVFNDPAWKVQWQLDNHGQFDSGNPGLDLNVKSLYKRGYSGRGAVVTVIDDGIDTEHPELAANYDAVASIDLNDPSNFEGDPHGRDEMISASNAHGTQAAGEIAAVANNSICGVGVAFNANLGGVRLLAGPVTDLLEAYALTFNPQYVQIYSSSWGPPDTGEEMKMPQKYSAIALEVGAKNGRGGKGSLYVFASGNGGVYNDNCGADGYVNNPFTIAITSVNIFGENARYDERCAALSAAVPVGGLHGSNTAIDPLVVTSAINEGCSTRFVGTSAAAPLASACLALTLEANPDLSWRDVQHLLPHATRLPNRHQQVWQRNGAGHLVSHYYGFGLMDCAQLVRQAQNWTLVGPQNNCTVGVSQQQLPIKTRRKVVILFPNDDNCANSSNRVDRAEQVLVRLRFKHKRRGDLSIWLTSPAGTRSPLLLTRERDNRAAKNDFTFLTLMSWDENPKGTWTLEISDVGMRSRTPFLRNPGTIRGGIKDASLFILGTSAETVHPKLPLGEPLNKPHEELSFEEIARVYNEQRVLFLQNLPMNEAEHRKKREQLNKASAVDNSNHVESREENEKKYQENVQDRFANYDI